MFDKALKTIGLGAWDFHVMHLEDMEMYNSYIRQTQYPAYLWSSNFAYMWAVSQSKKRMLLWKIVDGLLVTFDLSNKNTLYLFCLPYGRADPERLIDVTLKAMNYCLDWNKGDKVKSSLRMINEDQLEFLKTSPRFDELFTKKTWIGIERHYDINKLVSLKGKEFENVRNRINKFHKDNPTAKICPYRKADYAALLDLAERWKNTSGKKYTNVFDGVYYQELVKYSEELNQTTLLMRRGESIIGMISGGLLPTGQSWGSVVKFDENIPGLSETLIIEFAKEMHRISPQAKLLNIGSDLGPGGLRNYKLKFRPVLNLRRYQIYLK